MSKDIEWESLVVLFVFERGLAGKSLSVSSMTCLSGTEVENNCISNRW